MVGNKQYEVHGRNQDFVEGIRFHRKESGFDERNQVSVKGIRLR
jgi:hypothetical protein